jgi:hypothetical protein
MNFSPDRALTPGFPLGVAGVGRSAMVDRPKTVYNVTSEALQEILMVSDEIGMELHDRATTGETLSPTEQAQLEAWYAAKDQAEAAMFVLPNPPLPDIATLQSQIDQTLAQLAVNVQQLQQITQSNQSLRQENAQLKQQLDTRRSA